MARTIKIKVKDPSTEVPLVLPKNYPRAIAPLTLLDAQRTLKAASDYFGAPKKRRMALSIFLPLVGLTVLGVFLYLRRPATPATDDFIANATSQAQISGDTNPAVISVVDAAKLDQPFLHGALTGDKVLLYYIAKKAVVYRPSTKRVVKSGAFEPPPPRVFIRQGASGANSESVRQTIAATKLFNIVSTDQSPVQNYRGITIVDLTKHYPSQSQSLAGLLKANLADLPAGETTPEADLLVIIGD